MNLEPLFVCGPTASGKSALALELARRIGGEIINADAFQLYKGIEVLAASPSRREQELAPHHLYSILDISEALDAHRYRQLALPVIEEVQSRGQLPIVVGGSGLYLKFLTHGPSPVPAGDPKIREELAELSVEELLTHLKELDPVEAATINQQNRRYLTRSIELCLLTGEPVSQIRSNWKQDDPKGLRGYYLDWPRHELVERIALRSEAMLNGGAIEEVRHLAKTASTASKAIGISEIREYLIGQISAAEACNLITIATRQYAKRQRTWFRKEQWLTRLERNKLPEE